MDRKEFLSRRKATRINIPAGSVAVVFDKAENIAWLAESDRAGYKILRLIREVRCV